MYLYELICRAEKSENHNNEFEQNVVMEFFKYKQNYIGHIERDERYKNVGIQLRNSFAEYKAYKRVCELYDL